MHISIAAEPIFYLWSIFPVTNSVIYTLIVGLVLLGLGLMVSIGIKFIPGSLQSIFEFMIETFYDLVESITKSHAREFFPLIMTIFIFVLISNWAGLLPGLNGLGLSTDVHGEEVITPVLRSPTADLNTTFALALIAVLATQYYGLKFLGLKVQLSKYINLKSPVAFFVGILELISEFSRIMSFSFRLFGNIFAGEVLLVVIGMLVPLLLPVPFLALEVFVGLIQAVVFAILTAVLLGIAVAHK